MQERKDTVQLFSIEQVTQGTNPQKGRGQLKILTLLRPSEGTEASSGKARLPKQVSFRVASINQPIVFRGNDLELHRQTLPAIPPPTTGRAGN